MINLIEKEWKFQIFFNFFSHFFKKFNKNVFKILFWLNLYHLLIYFWNIHEVDFFFIQDGPKNFISIVY